MNNVKRNGIIILAFFMLVLCCYVFYKKLWKWEQDKVPEPPAINQMTGVKINELVEEEQPEEPPFVATFGNVMSLSTMEDYQKYLYTVDQTAYMEESDVDIKAFTSMDFRIPLRGPEPKILIFHTHSQETFIDSRPGFEEDTIVGMGRYLAEIFTKQYGVAVVHDVGKYDVENGKEERGRSYEKMEPAVKRILEKYPSIEVTIDLHRDGVPDNVHLVTEIDGKPTAQIMYFNGIVKENRNGKPRVVPELYNPHVKDNLALSLQAYLHTNEVYPGLARKIYIRPYRYSLHLKPKSMLIEAGANTNTVQEVKNAMPPLAKILMKTLSAD